MIAQEEETLVTSADIMHLLPHRHPFLFVDRVVAYEWGQSLTALKAVSIAEPCFAGHFPDTPVMPGVLVIEALAQACGIFGALERRGWRPGQPILKEHDCAEISALGSTRVAFRRPVFPGCVLALEVTLVRVSGGSSFFDVKASQGGRVHADGNIIVARLPRDAWVNGVNG